MHPSYTTLPSDIEQAITRVLASHAEVNWVKAARDLHQRYMAHESDVYIREFSDVLAYLALRVPATYTQHIGAMTQVKEILPLWQPETLLDLGAGPGTGMWAAKSSFPSLKTATAVEQENDFVRIGQQIMAESEVALDAAWSTQDAIRFLEEDTTQYDLIIIGNVLNELSSSERSRLVGLAYNHCRRVLLIIEPGTSLGADIVQGVARSFEGKAQLLAPYINNVFVSSNTYYLHFPKRFVRPEFERRVRQRMRDDSLTASDWEEAKYTYVALGKMERGNNVWGRCVGPIEKQKGFLLIPILTESKIEKIRVMKRHKVHYTFAKELSWGQIIAKKEDLIFPSNAKDATI